MQRLHYVLKLKATICAAKNDCGTSTRILPDSSSSPQNTTYTFTVVATDNGRPETRNNTADVTIVVFSPDNHFNPTLDQTSYTGQVTENDPAPVTVVRFTVTDEDRVGPASEISSLTLQGSDARFFVAVQTGTNSGEIRTK